MPLSSVLGAQSLVRPGVCTSSTRPASPFEGQVIYETDTDKVLAYNGSAWEEYRKAGAGQVLQVVSTTKTDAFSVSVNAGASADVTGLSASITPSSTSNKILVIVNIHGASFLAASIGSIQYKIIRDSTDICLGDAASSRTRVSNASGIIYGQNESHQNAANTFLDSPSTTSSVNYKVAVVNASGWNGGNGTMYVNRNYLDTNANYGFRATSTITLMEISG